MSGCCPMGPAKGPLRGLARSNRRSNVGLKAQGNGRFAAGGQHPTSATDAPLVCTVRGEVGRGLSLIRVKSRKTRWPMLGLFRTGRRSMNEQIKEKILALLDQHRIMTIATLRPDG